MTLNQSIIYHRQHWMNQKDTEEGKEHRRIYRWLKELKALRKENDYRDEVCFSK